MLTRRDGSDLRRRGENAHPAEPITRRCETTATQLLPWSLPVATVLTFSAPALVTQRTFQTDWTIHLWYLWEQSVALSHNHAPSLFVHADLVGLFWPHFAFYGGTMYALGGLLAIGLGHRPVIAFGLLHVLGFSM